MSSERTTGSSSTKPAIVDAQIVGAVDPRVVMLSHPRGAAAEQYRVLRQRIERAVGRGSRCIGVTSSTAGEGKTTTAVNLALALALGQRHRVALVDANLRSPSVHALLGLSPSAGLVEVIEGKVELDAALWRFRGDYLHVLPAGRTEAPYAVVASPRLRALLGELRDRFEIVIVDGAPILPTADMLTLGPILDGVMLVVQAGRTRSELIRMALDAIPDVPVLGCVLQRVQAGAGAPYRLFARHDREVRRALPAPAPAAKLG